MSHQRTATARHGNGPVVFPTIVRRSALPVEYLIPPADFSHGTAHIQRQFPAKAATENLICETESFMDDGCSLSVEWTARSGKPRALILEK
jgi:hypothetical protein